MTAPEKPELSNEELKPCPFCGSKADRSGSIVGCSKAVCGAVIQFHYSGEDMYSEEISDAIEAWNRRSQEAPQGKREWKAESAWEVLEEFSKHPHRGWCNADPLATNPKDCNCYVGKSKKVLANRVLAALSGGGDERWVLDELKKWIKSLDKKYLDGLYYPRLYGAILEKLSDLESQASGKVKK